MTVVGDSNVSNRANLQFQTCALERAVPTDMRNLDKFGTFLLFSSLATCLGR